MTLQEAEKVVKLVSAQARLRSALEELAGSGLSLTPEDLVEVSRLNYRVEQLTKRVKQTVITAETDAGIIVIEAP